MSKLGALNQKIGYPTKITHSLRDLKGFFCWVSNKLLRVQQIVEMSPITKRELQLGLAGLQNFCSKDVALERHQFSWLQKYSLLTILSFFSMVVGWAIEQERLWVMTPATTWRVPVIQLDLKAVPCHLGWLLLSCNHTDLLQCWQHSRFVIGLSHYWYFKGHFSTHLLTTSTENTKDQGLYASGKDIAVRP